MPVGKISGQMLENNLTRSGVDLAFETNLVYLDVTNTRVGINTNTPAYTLDVNGTTRSTNLEVPTTANIGNFTINGNTISSSSSTINLLPSGINATVYNARVDIGTSLELEGNVIRTISANTDINFTPNGTGVINLNGNTRVTGNLHATGTITADGNLQLGDANTDNIVFAADINSNITPDLDQVYNIGTASQRWSNLWANTVTAGTVSTGSAIINGIDLTKRQGKIYYVATNGNDGASGTHQNDPLSSLGQALIRATSGDMIYIYPGTYSETIPLTVPTGVTVRGAGIRSVTIRPDSATGYDVFLLNGETTVEDLTVSGHSFDSVNNRGYAFRFANNFTVTTRSPYVRNVSVITTGTPTSGTDPRGFAAGNAGKGALLDGSVVNAASKEATILFHSVTFITPGVDAITLTNGVRCEWLNSFTYFANRGIYAYQGTTGFAGAGQTRLKISSVTGTFNVGNTLTYYDTDGVTVLASGVIASIDGSFYNINGKVLGFESLTDRAGKTVYALGDAKLSTSVFKYGTASLALDGTGDYARVDSQPDFNFGTGDFTIEFWAYRVGTGVIQTLIDIRPSSGAYFQLTLGTTNPIRFSVSGVTQITGATLAATTWTHIALTRASGTTRLFVNGTVTATTYADTNNYGQAGVYIGATSTGTNGFNGYIDDLRISKGVAKYTASFTAPAAQLKGDVDTVLLLNFNGTNGSTIFTDNGLTFQDIRTSAGGTASVINFADYSDFGAEMRSIASACVYGNYGAVATGVGNTLYLISQNFGYIGSGKESNNDPTAVIQANEIDATSGAKIYYTSVDHQGDFRVGELFYVSQKTGAIEFSAQSFNITSLTGITFTDGTNTTIIDATRVETGKIRISGNDIISLSGDINITPASTNLNLNANTNVSGTLAVTGNTTLSSNLTVNGVTTLNSTITGNVVPTNNNSNDLGSTANYWRNVYAGQFLTDNIEINDNYIRTTVSNSNLELRASGTGSVVVDQLNFKNNSVTSNTTNTDIQINPNGTGKIQLLKDTVVTGNLDVTGNVTVNGNTTVAGITTLNSTVTGNFLPTFNNSYDLGSSTSYWRNVYAGQFLTDTMEINDNYIRTTVSNASLELRSNGTGSVVVDQLNFKSNSIISNTTNTDIQINPNGTGKVQLLKDTAVTGNLDISGNMTVGGNFSFNNIAAFVSTINSNIVPFYNNSYDLGSSTNYWRNIYAGQVLLDSMEINDNYIRTTVSNANLELRSNGTGSVVVDQLNFKSNTITSNTTNTDIQINPNGTGKIQLLKDTVVTGNLDVSGNVTVGGNFTFNNTPVFNAGINSSLIPFYNNSYDIGSSTNYWRNIYAGQYLTDNIEINDNYIRTTVSNSNLELRSNGTGSVVVDQLNFKSNTIISNATNTDIQINPNGTGKVQLLKDTVVTGNLNVTGNMVIAGNLTFGDQTTDTVNFVAPIVSNVLPATSYAYNLGSASLAWNNLYIGRIVLDSLELNDNYITSTVSNANLDLRANGTGSVTVDQLSFKSNLISSNTTNTDIQINPNGTGTIQLLKNTAITGNLSVSGTTTFNGPVVLNSTLNINASINGSLIPNLNNNFDIGSSTSYWRNVYAGQFLTDNIEVNDNYVRTTVSNSNLELRSNGTGSVVIDQLSFKTNSIISNATNTDIQITPNGLGKIQLLKDTDITGNLTVTGNFILGGNITIGDQTVDTVNFAAQVQSNILPASAYTYDLGSSSLAWRDLYAGRIFLDSLEINDNYITTTVSNANLELRANGTGGILVEDLLINQNVISSTQPNQDITLTPTGTGVVRFNTDQSVVLPAGTDAQRPATPSAGMIRYNTTASVYEGYNGSYWIQLGGVVSVDRKTYITPEATPGTNDNTIRFVTNNYPAATLTSTSFNVNALQVDDIRIDNNTISTTATNADLTLNPNGTGAVVVDNFRFINNTITNSVSGSVTELYATGTGYWKFPGTNGVVIPSGPSSSRPAVVATGMIRYNTELGISEVWDGTTWVSVAGASSGINQAQAEEIAATFSLIFG
jgi:hypothetical protein